MFRIRQRERHRHTLHLHCKALQHLLHCINSCRILHHIALAICTPLQFFALELHWRADQSTWKAWEGWQYCTDTRGAAEQWESRQSRVVSKAAGFSTIILFHWAHLNQDCCQLKTITSDLSLLLYFFSTSRHKTKSNLQQISCLWSLQHVEDLLSGLSSSLTAADAVGSCVKGVS